MRRGVRAICGSLVTVAATLIGVRGSGSGPGLLGSASPFGADVLRHRDFRRRLDLVAERRPASTLSQGFTPKTGAVLWCSNPNGVMSKGHVAVVSQVLTDRVIQVTQANWSIIEGSRGKVERDVTVVDVFTLGDWSQVKVWYDPVRDLGKTVYPTYGFNYGTTENAAQTAAVSAVRTVTQTAMTQLAAAVPTPGSSPAQAFSQAASSTDRIAALLQAASLRVGQPLASIGQFLRGRLRLARDVRSHLLHRLTSRAERRAGLGARLAGGVADRGADVGDLAVDDRAAGGANEPCSNARASMPAPITATRPTITASTPPPW